MRIKCLAIIVVALSVAWLVVGSFPAQAGALTPIAQVLSEHAERDRKEALFEMQRKHEKELLKMQLDAQVLHEENQAYYAFLSNLATDPEATEVFGLVTKRIHFDTEHPRQWRNDVLNLITELEAQSKQEDLARSQPLSQGCSKTIVSTKLGKPDSAYDYPSLGEEVWYYGSSSITFKNDLVSDWTIRSKELPFNTQSAVQSAEYSVDTSIAVSFSSPKPILSSVPASDFCIDDESARNDRYLGKLSTNHYDPDSISNSYGTYGSRYSDGIQNPYSSYRSRYSPTSPINPYAIDTPRIYASDGTYLGKLSSNRYDPESIFNPYGIYGNKYGNNLMNKYGVYGSRYSSQSWRNPYATDTPSIYSEENSER